MQLKWSVVVLFSMLLGRTLCAAEFSYYEKTLTEKNIKTTSDGLNEYLSGLHSNEQQRQRALRLIKALGATDSFFKREDAMTKLLLLPTLPNEELIAASSGNAGITAIAHLGRGETEFAVQELAPGAHRVIAVLADWAHLPMDPLATDTVRSTVGS